MSSSSVSSSSPSSGASTPEPSARVLPTESVPDGTGDKVDRPEDFNADKDEATPPSTTTTTKKQFHKTRNPHNQANIDLHRNRFRNDKHALAMTVFSAGAADRWQINDSQSRAQRLLACGVTQDWEASHLHLKRDMDVCKFVMDLDAQRLIYKLQVRCDGPHACGWEMSISCRSFRWFAVQLLMCWRSVALDLFIYFACTWLCMHSVNMSTQHSDILNRYQVLV
jgi:hypothetical protein